MCMTLLYFVLGLVRKSPEAQVLTTIVCLLAAMP